MPAAPQSWRFFSVWWVILVRWSPTPASDKHGVSSCGRRVGEQGQMSQVVPRDARDAEAPGCVLLLSLQKYTFSHSVQLDVIPEEILLESLSLRSARL